MKRLPFLQDVRFAIRVLTRQPVFVICRRADTAIFSVVKAVLLEPLACREPSRIGAIQTLWSKTNCARNVPGGDYPDLVAEPSLPNPAVIRHILMLVRKAFLFVALPCLFAVALTAQIDPQYQGWMRSMFPSLMAINNAADDKGTADAATKLADTFDQVAAYWKPKQSPDAVGFAEAARDAARAIAASGGDKAANLRKIQAQCNGCHMAHRSDDDPDRSVGGGKIPAGWSVRPDRGTADQINFTAAGDGYHFAMGPAGTFYRSDWTKSGNYGFSARLTQKQAPTHPISYGLSIGGSDQAGPNETYSYFLVRSRGEYFIANREGDRTSFSPRIFSIKQPLTVVDWTAHPAVIKQGTDGRQTNTLGIQVQGDTVIFTINSTEVTRLPKSKLHTDGMYGFRIGHNLDVDVDQVNR